MLVPFPTQDMYMCCILSLTSYGGLLKFEELILDESNSDARLSDTGLTEQHKLMMTRRVSGRHDGDDDDDDADENV